MHYYGYMGAGFSFWGALVHILVVILVIWFIITIVRSFCGPRGWRRMRYMHGWDMWQAHSALELLNERYAKGEIDKAEYEEIKKTLLGQ